MRIPGIKTADRRKNDEKRCQVAPEQYRIAAGGEKERRKNCRRSADRAIGRKFLALSKMNWKDWEEHQRPNNLFLGEKRPLSYGHERVSPKEEKTFITILEFDSPAYRYDGRKLYESDLDCYAIRIGALDKSGDCWDWYKDLALSKSEEWCKQEVARFLAEECAWRTLPHVPGDPTGEAEAAAAAEAARKMAEGKAAAEKERMRLLRFPSGYTSEGVVERVGKWVKYHADHYKVYPHPGEHSSGVVIECAGKVYRLYPYGTIRTDPDSDHFIVENQQPYCPECGLRMGEAQIGWRENPISKKDPDYCAKCRPDEEHRNDG